MDFSLNNNEQQRLVICLGLMASIITAITAFPNGDLWLIFKEILAISGISGFLYILLTASKLKYTNPGSIGDFRPGEKFRQSCFDVFVNTYGLNISILLLFGGYYLLGGKPTGQVDSLRLIISLIYGSFIIWYIRYLFKQSTSHDESREKQKV